MQQEMTSKKRDTSNQNLTTNSDGLQYCLHTSKSEQPNKIENRNDALQKITDELKSKFKMLKAPTVPFPSYKTLAWASYAAYKNLDDLENTMVEQKLEELKENFLKEWNILCTVYDSKSLYHGSAYVHKRCKQIIIAHRGTKKSNPGSLQADMDGIMKNCYTPQAVSAVAFTLKISEALLRATSVVENNMVCSKLNQEVQVSVTGHSLGGWLAQVTTFAAKYFALSDSYPNLVPKKDFHFHCVAFDSPGARNILHKLEQKLAEVEYCSMERLDIFVILGDPNPVNIVNQHAGQVLQLDLNLEKPNADIVTNLLKACDDSIETCMDTFPSHQLENFLKAFKNENKIKKILPLQWPLYIFKNWNTDETDLNITDGWKTYLRGVKIVIGPTRGKIAKVLRPYLEGNEKIEHCEFDPFIFEESSFNDLGLCFLKELKKYSYWKEYVSDNYLGEEFNHNNLLQNLSFHKNKTRIEDLKFLLEVNQVSQQVLIELTESNKKLVDLNGVLLLLESERYIREMDEKYFKVEFKERLVLLGNGNTNSNIRELNFIIPDDILLPDKYIDYIKLQVLNSLEKTINNADLWTVAIVSYDWLNNIVTGKPDFKNFSFSKKLKYLFIDCLKEKELSPNVMELLKKLIDCQVILLKSGPITTTSKRVKLSATLEESFIKSSDFQYKIIKFQGREVPLKTMFKDLTTTETELYFIRKISSLMLLLETKSEVVIGKPPPSFFDCDNNYVFSDERVTLNDFTEISDGVRDTSYFFINANSKDESQLELKELKGWENLKILEYKDNTDDYKGLFKSFCRSNPEKFVYLLTYLGNGSLVLNYCYSPDIYKVRKCKKKPNSMNLEEGLNLQPQTTSGRVKVLIDKPGNGKTTTLIKHVEEYFMSNPDVWTISLDLKSLKVPSFNENSWLDDFINFLLTISEEPDASENLNIIALTYRIFKDSDKLAIFLDSFDEILSKKEKLDLVKFLTHLNELCPQIKIVLSTRTHEYDNLAKNQNFDFIQFFDIEEKENFLSDIWYSVARILFNEEKNNYTSQLQLYEKVKEYASKVIEAAEDFLCNDLKFLAAPLQLEMLSTNNFKEVIAFIRNNNPSEVVVLPEYKVVKIYKTYIERKFRIYQEKKLSLALEEEIQNRLRSSFEKDLKYLAVRLLCNRETWKPLFGRCIENKHVPHSELLLTGIVTNAEGTNFEFSHRTFAEFYLAQVVFQNLQDCLTENYYEETRKLAFFEFFRNLMLENQTHNIFQSELLELEIDKKIKATLTVLEEEKTSNDQIINLFVYSLLFPFSDGIIMNTQPSGEIQFIKQLVSENLHELFIYAAFPFFPIEVRRKISAAFIMFSGDKLCEIKDIEYETFYKHITKWLNVPINWVEHFLRFYNFKRDSVVMRLIGCGKFKHKFLEYHFKEVMAYLSPDNESLESYADISVNLQQLIDHCMQLPEISAIQLLDGETEDVISTKLDEEIRKHVICTNTIHDVTTLYSSNAFKGKLNIRKLAEVLEFAAVKNSFGYLQFKKTSIEMKSKRHVHYKCKCF